MNDVEKYIATIEAHGGPAFPAKYKLPSDGEYQSPGMTLRDWFAGQALAGLAATEGDASTKYAYFLADAMLEARK